MQRVSLMLAVLALLVGAGCRDGSPASTEVPPAPSASTNQGSRLPSDSPDEAPGPRADAGGTPAPTAESTEGDALLRDDSLLQPVDNGPGLVVCEPVSRGAGREARELATGCSRWLQFWVSGQPEFGKSPLFSTVDSARDELGRSDLCLSRTEARTLARSVGATHAAVGEVTGNGQSCRITYRLLAVPSLQPVGEVILKGNPIQVRGALVPAAHKLCALLGAATPKWIAPPEESVAHLRLLGRLPWRPEETLPRKDLEELADEHIGSAVLAMMFIMNRSDTRATSDLVAADTVLRRLAPDNPVALAEAGRQSVNARAKQAAAHLPSVQELQRKNPNHFLYNAALAYSLRESGEFEAALAASKQAVRCAPRNPNAWLLLNGTYQFQLNAVRQGRYAGDLTEAELAEDARLSELSVTVLQQALALNPASRARLELSLAAAFAGDRKLAEESFWESVRRDPDSMAVYHWGLQMYHPKWYDDRRQASRVAKAAVAACRRAGPAWSWADRIEVAARCYLVGFRKEALRIARRPDERAEVLSWLKQSGEHQVAEGG